jgi:hypothetical protein
MIGLVVVILSDMIVDETLVYLFVCYRVLDQVI